MQNWVQHKQMQEEWYSLWPGYEYQRCVNVMVHVPLGGQQQSEPSSCASDQSDWSEGEESEERDLEEFET